MSALILSGKEVAAKVLAEVKASVAVLRERTGAHPTLAVILVGEDSASQIYVRNKKRAADEVGITTRDFLFPQGCSQTELLATIAGINRDPAVHGILLQLPLPKGMDEDAAVAAIAPEKDADGLHPMNLGRLVLGEPAPLPCTPLGIVELLRRYDVPIAGANVTVIGRGVTVGRPLGLLLTRRSENATVTLCHTGTKDLAAHTRTADIVVVAAGRPGLLTADMVKPGAAVVDVGITRTDAGLVGDVAPEVAEVAGWLAPMPGGIGPMTRAMLLANVAEAAESANP